MNGTTPFEIMALAIQNDLAMTRRYSHVAESSQRKAVERMANDFESSRSRDAVNEALRTRRYTSAAGRVATKKPTADIIEHIGY